MDITLPKLCTLIATPVVAFLVSALVCRLLTNSRLSWIPLDFPNRRSLHDSPVPRVGGLGIMLGILAGMGCMWILGWFDIGLGKVVAISFLVAITGAVDDWRGVVPHWRLLVQVAAACGLVLTGTIVERLVLPGISLSLPAIAAGVLSVLAIVWVTNLYNFMDGMDGFAAGMTVIGFGSMAILGGAAGGLGYALFCSTISAAAAAFLLFNFPPARIFMGDAGSGTVGFLAAACVMVADRRGLFPWWAGLVIFSPFVVDASWTLFRRALRREALWQAHREHFYQRLVRAGWSHRRVVQWEYALMVSCSLLILLLLKAAPLQQWVGLGFLAAAYAVIGLGVNALLKNRALE